MDAPTELEITHVALTVSDLQRSIAWYSQVFGGPPATTGTMLDATPHAYSLAVWRHPNLGLHHFAEQVEGPFSERRPGLDHVAFGCAQAEDLDRWVEHLDRLGIEHGNILVEPYGSGLSFRDPDGTALELFVRAPRPPT